MGEMCVPGAHRHLGMHGAQDIHFEKKDWITPEAAERMSQYSKSAAELEETEHFGAWSQVTVGKEPFAMVPKTAAVANIIDTHGKNRDFFGGVYKGKDHVLENGNYLVSEVCTCRQPFRAACLLGPKGKLQRHPRASDRGEAGCRQAACAASEDRVDAHGGGALHNPVPPRSPGADDQRCTHGGGGGCPAGGGAEGGAQDARPRGSRGAHRVPCSGGRRRRWPGGRRVDVIICY